MYFTSALLEVAVALYRGGLALASSLQTHSSLQYNVKDMSQIAGWGAQGKGPGKQAAALQ